jgi:putative aldouronate transport system permease protein
MLNVSRKNSTQTLSLKISNFLKLVVKDFKLNKGLYLMISPVLLFYIIFHFVPMYGLIIAFKDFQPIKGITGSEWVGFKHFIEFFQSFYFWRILKNTVVISVSSLIFGFPAPIILALLINELKNKYFKSAVQSISYMPHFISLVVVCGIIKDFTSDVGVVSYIITLFGGHATTLLNDARNFVPVYIVSDIWQSVGWGTIIYLAALTGIDQEQYEAAQVDGANKWTQTLHITIPGMMPTIIIMLVLKMGNLLSVGFEKIILLYNPAIYQTADVISSFVYRKGLQDFAFSYSAAVGLFNSLINFVLLVTANKLSKKFSDSSLW